MNLRLSGVRRRRTSREPATGRRPAADAITILEEVAADRVRILGSEHSETLTAQANLAVSYRQAGRTNDAITIQEQVAAASVRILGPEQPSTRAVVAALQQWKGEP